MDISWSGVLAGISVETQFAFLISAVLCSLTLWGFTVSLFLSAGLFLCNSTGDVQEKTRLLNIITHIFAVILKLH